MLTDAHTIIYSFGLPPAEVAAHPANANDRHELYLICALPGGGKLGMYQPRHAQKGA